MNVKVSSLLGYLVGGVLRKIIYSKCNLNKDKSSMTVEEIKKDQVQKFKALLKHYSKTPYGKKVLSELAPQGDLESLIRSEEDIKKFPTISRDELINHGKEMLVEGSKLSKLRQFHTSGTTTGIQVIRYASMLDIMQGLLSSLEAFKMGGIKPNDKIRFLIPKESSLWYGNGLIQFVVPRLRYVNSNSELTENQVIDLLKSDAILSYTTVPLQVFRDYENLVSRLREENKINLKLIILTGGYASKANVNNLRKLLGKGELRIVNPLMSIECTGLTKTCSRGHNHLVTDFYYAWTDDNGELIVTSLFPFTMVYPNYKTGDVVDIQYADDCELSNEPILIFKGRTMGYHKSLREPEITEALDATLAQKLNIIRLEWGGIHCSNNGKEEYDIFIVKNKDVDGFYGTKEDLEKIQKYIIKENPSLEDYVKAEFLYQSLEVLNNYALQIYTSGKYSNWGFNFHLVNKDDESYKKHIIGHKYKFVECDDI